MCSKLHVKVHLWPARLRLVCACQTTLASPFVGQKGRIDSKLLQALLTMTTCPASTACPTACCPVLTCCLLQLVACVQAMPLT